MHTNPHNIQYHMQPAVSNADLNALFAVAWPTHAWRDFQPILKHSLAYVCGYANTRLIGFVNLAWDGGIHAFLLDTTVHPDVRRRGIGRQLVLHTITVARERGMAWLHVDYAPHLEDFYRACGFQPTLAGVIALPAAPPSSSDSGLS
jgi:GNAT superfamily N-acetyltransferase